MEIIEKSSEKQMITDERLGIANSGYVIPNGMREDRVLMSAKQEQRMASVLTLNRWGAQGDAPFLFGFYSLSTRRSMIRSVTGEDRIIEVVVWPKMLNLPIKRSRSAIEVAASLIIRQSSPVT